MAEDRLDQNDEATRPVRRHTGGNQAGGRGPGQVAANDDDDDLASDQVAHQDRGQSVAEAEKEDH